VTPSAHLERSRRYAALAGKEWQALDQIGAPAPYRGPIVSSSHRQILEAPLGRLGIPINIDLGIDGYLQREDALKLYELAYFSAGDVLEFGTHKGLSASIIARALWDGGGERMLETVDIDANAMGEARRAVALTPGGHHVTFAVKDAVERLGELAEQKRRFGFIFVDHWHGYEATLAVARRCKDVLLPGGYVQFHDFLDPSNADPQHVYGVYQAVLDSICEDDRFVFDSLAGCTAVFRFATKSTIPTG
jgi:predicted O-methyltransferase YrrM